MDIVDDARAALAGPGHPPHSPGIRVPAGPGLYAIHADAAVWSQLGLGEPPDDRPIYVGKAERSLANRDLGTHFGTGRTGQSTLRRSLAGLLATELALQAVPRNLDAPAYYASFAIEPAGDQRLTDWMLTNLRLATWSCPASTVLAPVETAVLRLLVPPLNLSKVSTPWRRQVSTARQALARQARDWRPTP
ncbi:GIY-YIG nuclease family protein [Georgenia phoenicis]|uniref:GIY-YIG nuclease family protein n=1 Tax=unclassified Georgenia TaxID=2626815 RepID=UPI0039B040AB